MKTISDEHPDVSYYIDAVKDAGQRSRAIILLIIFLMFFSFTALRNNYTPEWMLGRLKVNEKIYTCIYAIIPENTSTNQNKKDINSDQCRSLRYLVADAMGFKADGQNIFVDLSGQSKTALSLKDISSFLEEHKLLPYDSVDILNPAPLLRDILKERIHIYIKKNLETRQSQIPIIGSVIDINDLWVVSGLMMAFLLYFLSRSYHQEIVNARHIKDHFPNFFDVVKRTQVLVQFGSHPDVPLVGSLVFVLPSLIQIWLLYIEFETYLTGKAINPSGNIIQYVFIFGSSLLLFAANYAMLKAHKELESLF